MKIKKTIFLLLMNIVVMNLYAADNSCDYDSYSTPPKKTPAINA